jgi:murein L,D-transpeptidase YafK
MRARLLVLTLCLCCAPVGAAAAGCPRPELHIHKGKGELILTCAGKVRHRALVSFGGNPIGHKLKSGDQRTPEGRYKVCKKYRSGRYYKFISVNYPGPQDARAGLKRRAITRKQLAAILAAHRKGRCPPFATRLGGAIGVHGFKGNNLGVKLFNRLSRLARLYRVTGLSDGCIVASNDDMDRIWPLIRRGTPIYIRGVDAK